MNRVFNSICSTDQSSVRTSTLFPTSINRETKETMSLLNANTLIVKAKGRYIFLDMNSISSIIADGNYSQVYCQGEKYLVRDTLKAILMRLDERLFVRISRSVALNVTTIQEIKHNKNSTYEVTTKGNKKWVWSAGYKNNLSKLLNQAQKLKYSNYVE